MEASNIPFGLSRETNIRRTADGQWFVDGDAMDNPRLARAFDRWIERAEDGRYCLKNDVNWAYFTLEGAPFFVRSVRITDGTAELSLSNDQQVRLDPRTLREGPEGALYCDVLGGEPARFDKHAAVQLGDLLEEDSEGPFFWVGDARVRPPRVQDPLHSRQPNETAREQNET